MLIARKHPYGGRPLTKTQFPLREDPKTNMIGFCIGYIDRDSTIGEPVILPLNQVELICQEFCYGNCQYKKRFADFQEEIEKKTMKERLITVLGGHV